MATASVASVRKLPQPTWFKQDGKIGRNNHSQAGKEVIHIFNNYRTMPSWVDSPEHCVKINLNNIAVGENADLIPAELPQTKDEIVEWSELISVTPALSNLKSAYNQCIKSGKRFVLTSNDAWDYIGHGYPSLMEAYITDNFQSSAFLLAAILQDTKFWNSESWVDPEIEDDEDTSQTSGIENDV